MLTLTKRTTKLREKCVAQQIIIFSTINLCIYLQLAYSSIKHQMYGYIDARPFLNVLGLITIIRTEVLMVT